MLMLNFSRRLILCVLILYGLTLGVAMAAPIVNAGKMSLICSSTGYKFVQLDINKSDPNTKTIKTTVNHVLECSQCVATGIIPNLPQQDAYRPVHTLSYVLQAIPAARLASIVSAPLPARGPPHFI